MRDMPLRCEFGMPARDDGNYVLISGAAALSLAATAWMILGLRAAFGNPGLGIGAVAVVLIGNPLSGLSSAPEMLPEGWSTLGKPLPPGAGGEIETDGSAGRPPNRRFRSCPSKVSSRRRPRPG
ncbi:hypothetical protein FH609_030485 [Streptomyces sp. 3MP-14]|uniref:Uncharacterized protein n=1 Tax=Streptomyces mimosae TaxID=2586635 RepID=A0A5N5ZNJ5_9ACTN|nr:MULTISPECIES: hypothetical protein [Streptomyces]KAB8157442.1 hypothetical protein FH607_030275 [Streptomyces mimosae]KAB8172266.1 hypothetical protein FH609_030485 [Streptomyces sp. 3MP-14]